MTIQELKLTFLNDLTKLYPKEEIQSFFNLLISYRLKLSRADILLSLNQIIKQGDLNFFLNSLTELQQEKPIQYIIGETEFYGLPFKVDKNVLIPRPETEELVDWILNELRVESLEFRVNSALNTQHSALNILDIGTGSGCIAISLAKNLPKSKVYALDISKKSLEVALQNAKLNKVEVTFIELDILKTFSLKNVTSNFKFDVIVSNPPYIRDLEKHEIKNNVLKYEPQLALFVKDNNPLLFYDKIADLAIEYLQKDGLLYFEINQYLGKETVQLLKQKRFTNIELKKDILGNYRMIKANL